MTEVSWLLGSGSKVGHVALSGRKSAYALGEGPGHPDGKVKCGYEPDNGWTTATLDLDYEPGAVPCDRCVPPKARQLTLGANLEPKGPGGRQVFFGRGDPTDNQGEQA